MEEEVIITVKFRVRKDEAALFKADLAVTIEDFVLGDTHPNAKQEGEITEE